VTNAEGGPPDGIILGTPPTGGVLSAAAKHNALVDVVPLRDVILAAPGGNTFNDKQNGLSHGIGNGFWFEKTEYKTAANQTIHAMPHRDRYDLTGNEMALSSADTNQNVGLNQENHYTCAWGPSDTNLPKMIRIVVRVDDAEGRLSDGQTFEYVTNLP
jgi:hypothetical protein